jgi:lysophospholipase L1-like esterase
MGTARRVALMLAALLLVALVVEVGLRVRAGLAGKAPENASRSLRAEWAWALKHIEAGAARLPSHMTYDAELGWRLRPDPDGPRRVNSAGMRSGREFSVEPPAGIRRILFIGDSYTFGAGVADGGDFASVLGRDLPGWEVLNLSVSGYGPDQSVLSFESRGRRYRPDVVILGFYVRGYQRMFSTFRSYAKPWFELDARGELVLHGAPVPPPEELYEAYVSGERSIPSWNYSYLFGTFGKLMQQVRDSQPPDREARSWQTMAVLLQRFRDGVLENGGEPFLLIIPNRPEDYRGSFVEIDRLARLEATELGIPVLSLAAAFGENAAQVYRRREIGGHLSAEGHIVVAALLADALREAGLVPSEPRSPSPQ